MGGRWPMTVLGVLLLAAAAPEPVRAQEGGAPAAAAPSPEVERARALLNEAVALAKAGKPGEGIKPMKEAAEILEREQGETPESAMAVDLVGVLHFRASLPGEALPHLRRGLEMRRRLFPDGSVVLMQSLSNVASANEALGRPDQALPFREEAVAVARRLNAADNPPLAMSLRQLGATLRSAGRATDAIPPLEESLAMLRRLFPGDHPEVANAANSLAVALHGLARSAEAVPLLEEVIAIRRKLDPAGSLEVANALNNLAGVYNLMGRAADARPIFEEALALQRRLRPGDSEEVAASLDNLAVAERILGHPENAYRLHVEALDMRRRLYAADHPLLALSINNVASNLDALGRSVDALALREEALAMRRRLFSGDHPAIAESLRTSAVTLRLVGRPAEGVPLFEESLKMFRRVYPGDHPETANAINSLAVALEDLGRVVEVLPLREEALGMWRRLYPAGHLNVATALQNLALTTGQLGRFDDALPLLEEALAMQRRLFPGDHPESATILSNLASTLTYAGRHAEAIPILEEVVAMLRRIHPGGHPDIANALSNLASGLESLRRPADALPLHEEALALSRGLLPGDHPNVAAMLVNLAGTLGSLGRADDALPLQREAAEIALRSAWSRGQTAFVPLGRALLRRGDAAGAAEWFERGVVLIENLRSASRGLGSEERIRYIEKLRLWDPYPGMVRACIALGDPSKALAYSERGRGREMLDLLEQGRSDPFALAEERARLAGDEKTLAELTRVRVAVRDAEAIAFLREQEETKERTAARAVKAKGAKDEAGVAAEQAAVRRVMDAVAAAATARRDRDKLRARETRLLRDVLPQTRSATVEEMAALLAPGERLLEFDIDDTDGWLFVLRPAAEATAAGGAVAVHPLRDGTLPLNSARLAGRVGPILASLSAPGKSDAAALAELFRILLPASAWEEVRRAPAAIVLAQGPLHALPLEVLVVGTEGGTPVHWLDAGPPVAYAASGGVLRWLRDLRARQDATAKGPPTLLAVADPLFAGEGGVRPRASARVALRGAADILGGLSPLPGTRTEVDGVRKAFEAAGGKTTVLAGKEATEARLLAAATARPRYLHLATHGVADETGNASWSFLALTPPAVPEPGNDGALSLRDLLERWGRSLEDTRVAILSACDTQKGRSGRHEGTMALPWGFHFAGCPTVVATLWPVSDESTPRMMEFLHKRLLAGDPPLVALVAARRDLRAARPDPFYWGPFVLLGEGR